MESNKTLKKKRFTKDTWLNLFVSVISVLAVGMTSRIFSSFNKVWYEDLLKSSLNPPNAVFGIVWGVLYVLIAISLFLALQNKVSKKTIVLYVLNGFLNILWCLFFFTLKNPIIGLIILILNVVLSMLLLKALFKESRASFFLLLPYVAWLCFATYLNYSIVMMN